MLGSVLRYQISRNESMLGKCLVVAVKQNQQVMPASGNQLLPCENVSNPTEYVDLYRSLHMCRAVKAALLTSLVYRMSLF